MSLRVGLSRISRSRPNPVARSLLYRHLNSSANVPASVTRYLTSLKADIENTAIIHRDYPLLRWEFDQGNLQSLQSARLLDKNEIETMLQTLALSAHPEDLSRIEQILSDMTKVFNLPPTPETHAVIIRALIQKGSFQTVKLWLEHMPKKPGGVKPTLYHHHLVLEAGPQFCSFKNMEQLVQDMRQRGCEPVDETFKHLALARWLTTTRVSRIALPADFTPIFEDMKDTGLPYNTTIAEMLSAMYLDKQRFRYAEEIMALYNQVYSDLISPELIWENEWLLRFSSAVNDGDIGGGLRLLPKYLEEGGKPSVRLLGVFMKRISRLDRLCTVRDQLGVVPSPEQWSMVLLQCIKRGGISETMECYNRIRAEGVMPTANTVSRLIQFIATTHFDDAHAAIENCIQVFKEFLTSLPDRCDQLPRETQRSLADLYSTMLKELSQLPSQQLSEEYMSMQESVFRDAEIRKIPLQSASAYLTAISMRAAHSEGEAMEAYRESKHVLDEAGYLAVLDVLSRISWSDRMEPHVPRISFYFEIVKDMKAARYSITTEVYLILLRSLGQLADRILKYFCITQIIHNIYLDLTYYRVYCQTSPRHHQSDLERRASSSGSVNSTSYSLGRCFSIATITLALNSGFRRLRMI